MYPKEKTMHIPLEENPRVRINHPSCLNEQMRTNLKDAMADVEKGWPVIFIIDGGLHSGKTTTAGAMAFFVQDDFNMDKQIGRGVDQFAESWKHTVNTDSKSKVKVCVFDEAQTFSRRAAMTKVNKALYEFFTTCREYKIMLIFCLPHFRVLDNSVYDTDAVLGLIHMENIYHRRRNSYAEYRQYDASQIAYMLDVLDNERKYKHRNRKAIYNRVPGITIWGRVMLPKWSEDMALLSKKGKESIQKRSLDSLEASQ